DLRIPRSEDRARRDIELRGGQRWWQRRLGSANHPHTSGPDRGTGCRDDRCSVRADIAASRRRPDDRRDAGSRVPELPRPHARGRARVPKRRAHERPAPPRFLASVGRNVPPGRWRRSERDPRDGAVVIAVHPLQRARLEEKLQRELGEAVLGALIDPDVIEVMLNPDGQLWLETHRNGLVPTAHRIGRLHAENLLGTIAAILGTVVTSERPLLEGTLPDGSRFQGALPPISPAPSFVIRKRAQKVYSFGDYVASSIMEPWQAEVLRAAIVERQNIVIAGGTGSGKTTLANATLAEMALLGDPSERF